MLRPGCSGSLFLIGSTINAIHATNIANVAKEGNTLDAPVAVTEPPSAVIDPLNLLLGYGPELKPRAEPEGSAIQVTIAPDETCGFINGKKDSPVTCPNSRSCSWAASSGAGLIACASQIYVSCVESSRALDSAECDEVCQSNTYFLLCTESDQPFCNTYAYPEGILDYRCASTIVDYTQSVYFTSEGESRANLVTTTLDSDSSGTSEVLEQAVTVPVQAQATGSPANVTIYIIPKIPSAPAISSDSSNSRKKSTSVGPIVGGVVGGVAVVGLIGLGVLLLLRRRKDKGPEYMAPTSQPNMAYAVDQNHYPYHPQHHGVVPPYTDANTVSPAPLDTRMSMMTGSVSPYGQNAYGGGGQLSPSTVPSPAPAYEMAGTEAREPEPVYEIGGGDSQGRK